VIIGGEDMRRELIDHIDKYKEPSIPETLNLDVPTNITSISQLPNGLEW
jgi:hypothetical protein